MPKKETRPELSGAYDDTLDELNQPPQPPAEAPQAEDPPVVAAPPIGWPPSEPVDGVARLALFIRRVSDETPTLMPANLSFRVADTGRTLTFRQAKALHRLTQFCLTNAIAFGSRSVDSGLRTCTTRAHVPRILLDLFADALDEIDKETAARGGAPDAGQNAA